jgi:hypothetical protein
MDLRCWKLIGRHFDWTVEYFFLLKRDRWLNDIYELLNDKFLKKKKEIL